MATINSTARETFKKNLNKYMEMRGMDQSSIVSALKITASTVSDWVNGKKYPRVDAMQRLADLLGVSMSELTASEDDIKLPANIIPVKKVKIPLLGSIAAGVPIYANEDFSSYIEADSDICCDFALIVEGDSMEPTIKNGDIVFVLKQDDVDDGQIAAVIIDDSATLKRVYHIPGGVQLISENPKYPPQIYTIENSDYLAVLGRAVAYKRVL